MLLPALLPAAATAATSNCTHTVHENLFWGPVACSAYNKYGWRTLQGQYVPSPGTTQSAYFLQEWYLDALYSCTAFPPNVGSRERQVTYCQPQALYVATAAGLHAVNASSGTSYALDSQPADPEAMASLDGSVYEVVDGTLKKVNVETGAVAAFSDYPDGWAGTEAMTSLGDSLYAVQAGGLWRVHRDGWVVPFSDYPDGWAGTEAMTSLGDSLYVVQAGTLYRVRNDGDVWAFGAYSDAWAGTAAMAAKDGFVYGIQADALWAVHVATGAVAQVGAGNWSGTAAMVAR